LPVLRLNAAGSEQVPLAGCCPISKLTWNTFVRTRN
jgi:hypothetical protein